MEQISGSRSLPIRRTSHIREWRFIGQDMLGKSTLVTWTLAADEAGDTFEPL
jgi:hypothetical protein